ncbi:hypothetical protein APHCR_1425 [Anaplasma phagocytophilum str. CR1007]|nr:hypothetical protein EPHNCH_0695 [Anaplasma phagocytophilum str. NCH-1]KKA00807.1 hypothetical protein APHCR_1425 [Anaplasma phagocytophilum str. CR1007]
MFGSVSVLEPREMAMNCMGSGGSIGKHFMYAAIRIVVSAYTKRSVLIRLWLPRAGASSDSYLRACCITFQGIVMQKCDT